jgi:hypothetical protein
MEVRSSESQKDNSDRILVGFLPGIFHSRDIAEGEKIGKVLIEIPYLIQWMTVCCNQNRQCG